MSLDTFEQSLLAELRQHVGAGTADRDRAVARRRRALGVAGGGLAAAGAAVVVISFGVGAADPTAAYAVESQPDGDVVVTVHDLSDATGLEHALAAEGVAAEITYTRTFTQTEGRAPSASGGGPGCDIALAKVDGGLRFTLAAAPIAAGADLDIVTSGSGPDDVGSPVAVTWIGGGC